MAGCQLNVSIVPRGMAEGLEGDVFLSTIHRSKDMTRGQLVSYILKEGGYQIQKDLNETNQGRDLRHGQVVLTTSGELTQFKHLMFICLYRWQSGNDEMLQGSVMKCLDEANHHHFETIVLPALGTGGLRYPLREAAAAISNAILVFQRNNPHTSLKNIYICLQDELFSPQSEYVRTLERCLAQTPEIRFSMEDSQDFSGQSMDASWHRQRAPDSECDHDRLRAQDSERPRDMSKAFRHRNKPRDPDSDHHHRSPATPAKDRQFVRYDRHRMEATSGKCDPWAVRARGFYQNPFYRLEGELGMGRSPDGVHHMRAGVNFKNPLQNVGGEVEAECAIM